MTDAGHAFTRAAMRALAVATAVATFVALAAPAGAEIPSRESVTAGGTAGFFGSTGNLVLNRPITDIAPTGTGNGYWLLGGDGGVFSFGDAAFHGSTGNLHLNRPAVRMAPTPSGRGYWFVAGDGGVFAFGDAPFLGSMGGTLLNRPVIGIMATASGNGYWLVAADGGVFAFGDAPFRGSLGNIAISAPIVALAPTVTNQGYWLVGHDGAVYAFGDAPFLGSDHFVTGLGTDIAAIPDGSGYVVLDETGGVWTHRSGGNGVAIALPRGGSHAGAVAIGLAFTPDGNGTWLAWSGRAHPDPIVLAFARGGTKRIAGMHWSRCRAATWRFDPANAPPGALSFFEELFDYASRTLGMNFVYGGTTSINNPIPPDTIVMAWTDLSPLEPSALGLTRPLPPNDAIVWLASNWRAVLPEPGGTFDWGSFGWGQVAIHELGHALGLDHIEDPASVMNPSGNILLHWGPGDLSGLRDNTSC